MNRVIIFEIVFVLFLACKCGNSGRNQEQNKADTLGTEVKPSLPQLAPGEINLTDKAFGETVNLTGEPVSLKEIIKPEQLLVKNDYLITSNQRNDSLFMIFHLPDLECVAAFGIRGRGPDEFAYPPRIFETYEDSVLFYIYEMSTQKVYKVTRKKMSPEYFTTLPTQKRSLGDKQIMFVSGREAYYAMSSEKGKSVYYFNVDSVPQERLFHELAIKGLKGSWTTYIGDFGINIDQNRIAYAYKYFRRLRMIDIQTHTERDIIFKAGELAEGQSDIANLEPTNITHFWGMSANDKFFWMLYSGRTPVDVYNANRSGNKYIFVEKYDWNGNPLKRFRLDDWGYFCVSPDNKTLYLASTAGIHSLLKYELPE